MNVILSFLRSTHSLNLTTSSPDFGAPNCRTVTIPQSVFGRSNPHGFQASNACRTARRTSRSRPVSWQILQSVRGISTDIFVSRLVSREMCKGTSSDFTSPLSVRPPSLAPEFTVGPEGFTRVNWVTSSLPLSQPLHHWINTAATGEATGIHFIIS